MSRRVFVVFIDSYIQVAIRLDLFDLYFKKINIIKTTIFVLFENCHNSFKPSNIWKYFLFSNLCRTSSLILSIVTAILRLEMFCPCSISMSLLLPAQKSRPRAKTNRITLENHPRYGVYGRPCLAWCTRPLRHPQIRYSRVTKIRFVRDNNNINKLVLIKLNVITVIV